MTNAALKIVRLELGPYGTNAYLLICEETQEAVLVDAPAEAAAIQKAATGLNMKLLLITHRHFDHTGALEELRAAWRVPVGAHPLDAPGLPCPVDVALNDGDIVLFGKIAGKVLHTPGHTPGSLCLLVERQLLAGDTIFPGGPGNTRTPGDFKRIVETITTTIFALPDDTEVHPGHGPATNLGNEKHDFAAFAARPHSPDLCGDVLWLSS